MDNQFQKTNAGQGLGIAGFVLGAIAIVICWIPCIGVWAILPGGIGIILTAIAFSQAARGNGRKGFIIAGLVISIVSTSVAIWQYFALQKAASEFKTGLQEMETEWQTAMDSMNNTGFFNDFEDAMEDLDEEMQNVSENINETDWDSLINEDNYDELINEYEEMVDEYIDFVKQAEKGSIKAVNAYMKASSKLMIFTMKLATIMPNLTQEQIDRFNQIDEKYKEYVKE